MEEDHGRGDFFYLGKNIRILIVPKVKPGETDKFVDEEEEIGIRWKE